MSEAELIVSRPDGSQCRYPLPLDARLVVGRGEQADVRLEDDGASRRHLMIARDADGLKVTDLGSRNGTLLGGARLTPYEERVLSQGGELRIGDHLLELLAPAASPAAEAFGSRVRDEYEPLRELGRGAAGVVHAARHRASGRTVAIKLLELSKVPPRVRERFLREARLRLDSPHVVSVYQVRREGAWVFLVMELLEGGSLESLLARGPLPVARALSVAEQVARALAAAHAQGLVHRDVKPANVLLTKEGRAKLGDFGIAKELGSELTTTGQGMGTLAYVAPEQALDAKRAGPEADLYALGATLYHALAGRPPFLPQNAEDLQQVLDEDPPPLRGFRPDCPPPVERLVHRLLEKEPVDRLPNAEVLARKLASLRGELEG